ncbi:hypothetical protein [Nostoc punctiforme]|uniref:Uncharacterized protein n=1 Tax=Nostoc punctiforme (strain ATCC 29133 / PCC 73102) TaxID=63737 RepID=B2J4G9_NOSP7|nr:hypothetical protein [Nostoc punctiforme]ACC83659.1 hypothetical protein Npun_R5344 [Nostoc punctiforme PCC 73102]
MNRSTDDSYYLPPSIELTENHVLIYRMAIPLKNAISYLQQFPQSEYEDICRDAFELGFLCLQTAQTRHGNELIKQQMESLLVEFQQAVKIIADSFGQELVNQVGTDNGQLLAPLQAQINLTSAILTEKLNSVGTLLTHEIDPARETSVVGRFLNSLRQLLDAKRSDSIQGAFKAALINATKENGTLAVAVKNVVSESVKPLAEQVEKLTREIRDQQITQQVLEQTTAKGITYEELVVVELQNWSKLSGAEVEHIGNDGDTGDILVKFTSKSLAAIELSIVIELRNRSSKPFGRQAITQHLQEAMVRRSANSAIFLSYSREGLAQEIGDWAEGVSESGYWIATTHPFLIIAIRFLVIQQRLNKLRTFESELDVTAVEQQIQQIRTALGRIRTMKKSLTEVGKSIAVIKAEADAMSTDIQSALKSIEQTLSVATTEG